MLKAFQIKEMRKFRRFSSREIGAIFNVNSFNWSVAGASGMNYRAFSILQFGWRLLCGLTLLVLGFCVGKVVPGVHLFLYPVVGIIILLSAVPWIIRVDSERVRRHI